jgi:hypothetical protein
VKAGYGKWLPVEHTAAGRPARKFQLLPASAPAQFPISPSVAPNSAGADVDSSPGNEVPPGSAAGPPSTPDKTATTASVQMMMTQKMRADLLSMGYSQAAIDKMRPQQASDILAKGKLPDEAPEAKGGIIEL